MKEMNVLVIIANPQKGSFNHAIAETVVDTLKQIGHKVVFHDLYLEDFNPIIKAEEILPHTKLDANLQRHCEELCAADGIVIIHPNWWGQPPAILKGWIDRVFRAKVAYRFEETGNGEGIPVGLLKAKKAVVFNTSNTKEEREQETFGDPLETLWKKCIFGLCGVKNVKRKTFSVVITSTQQQRQAWLKEAAEIIVEQFPKNTTVG
jgi:putative NADPH-quinone reductase